ncbi:DUF6126 family protein [Streptomyces pathocidini]|uniref:DUF6126 family protein n=1 Tax=Streptomyces pathocidini TaxID=1650571 RepID=A0ABW7UP05_9ACTN
MSDDVRNTPDAPGVSGTSSHAQRPSSDSKAHNEGWKEKGVILRVGIYVFATHLFAGFVWLLFYVGDHAGK